MKRTFSEETSSRKINFNCSGISLFGLLGITFIVLRLCDVIDWSWWWVLAPFWGWFAIAIIIVIIAAIVYSIINKN